MIGTPEIIRFPNRVALAQNAAQRFVTIAREAIAARGRFSVALSGGSTPRDLYALLAMPEFSEEIDWANVHLFWGDERAVPPDNPESNYCMVNETLLSHVLVPAQNIHRILAQEKPAEAARTYEEALREFFELEEDRSGRVPRFDLILLGLGANGHTASLFPHTKVLHETQRWVASEYVAEVKMDRITLTVPVINAAENILFLVAGADKAVTVHEVLRGAYRPEDLPAQLVQPSPGRCVWLLDQDAASQMVD